MHETNILHPPKHHEPMTQNSCIQRHAREIFESSRPHEMYSNTAEFRVATIGITFCSSCSEDAFHLFSLLSVSHQHVSLLHHGFYQAEHFTEAARSTFALCEACKTQVHMASMFKDDEKFYDKRYLLDAKICN